MSAPAAGWRYRLRGDPAPLLYNHYLSHENLRVKVPILVTA